MKSKKSALGMIIMISILGILVFYPLVMVVYGSFWSGRPGSAGHFTFQGFVEAFSHAETIRSLWTTLWLSVVRVALSLVIGIALAWLLARTDLPFKGSVEIILWMYFFLPLLPLAMAWVLLLAPKWGLINQAFMSLFHTTNFPFNIYSYGGIIWVHVFYGVSVTVMMLRPAFSNMDASLEESSRMCGCNSLATLVRITIPMMLPSILGVGILTFMRVLESFEIELLLGFPSKIYVYTTKIYDLLSYLPPRYPEAMALTVAFVIILFAVILINWRAIGNKQYTVITGRSYQTRPIALGYWKWVLFVLVLIYIFISTLLPLAALTMGTFMKVFGVFPDKPFTTEHWSLVFGNAALLRSVKNTVLLGIAVALVSLLICSLASYMIVKTRLTGRKTLDLICWLPWSVPGLVLALGMLWAFIGGLPFINLYGTFWLMMLALIIKVLPLGVVLLKGSMVQIDNNLEESARVHGASWIRASRSIILPILLPTFFAVGIIIFLIAARDLVTVILLYSPKWTVMSVLMLEYWQGHDPGGALVVALLLSVLVIVVALIGRFIASRRGFQM